MAKDKISDYSSTANSNTDIAGINIDEGCAPSGINDAIRTLMAQLKTWQSGGQDVYIHPAGSASAPSITANGDTNTGIFFPAADTVGISTGGTERARVDSSGNMGLGTTPSSWGSSFRALQVTNASALWSATSGDLQLANNAYYDGTNYKFVYGSGSAYAAQYQQKDGKHIWQTAGSGSAGGTISFTQAMTLDASGNLGVGTTSPTGAIAAGYTSRFTAYVAGGNAAINIKDPNGDWFLGTTSANLTFYSNTAGAERARIDSSGNLLVGTTSANGSYNTRLTLSSDSGTTKWAVGPYSSATNFVVSAGSNGVYLAGTSATSWSSASDERAKADLQPIENGLQKVCSLRALTGRYIEDETNTRKSFLIAQDVLAVLPEAVDTANPEKYGLAYTDTIPLLVAAIKELKAEFDAYKASHP
jgi:hypothetical protein